MSSFRVPNGSSVLYLDEDDDGQLFEVNKRPKKDRGLKVKGRRRSEKEYGESRRMIVNRRQFSMR